MAKSIALAENPLKYLAEVNKKMVKKWYEAGVETGWQKTQSATTRRRRALKAHKGSHLAAGRGLQALANVTQDKQTARLARADAKYFFERHSKSGK